MTAYCLVENFYDTKTFPSHTITGEDADVVGGHEGFRVAAARRHSNNFYTPQTANVGRYVEAACDRVRFADMLVIDRNHNLNGIVVRIQASNQAAFTTFYEVSFTVPANTFYGDALTAGHPVRTEEGAIVVKFTGTAAKYWRVEVDAMGSGLKPQIGGLTLGQSWSPTKNPVMPWDDEPIWIQRNELRKGMPTSFAQTGKELGVGLRLRGEVEWSVARYHIHSLFWRGKVMWYVPDADFGERTWLAFSPAGTRGAPFGVRLARDINVPLSEYQPVLP